MVATVLLIVFNLVQKKFPQYLPKKLRTWDFLPRTFRSIFCGTSSSSLPVDVARSRPNSSRKVFPIELEQMASKSNVEMTNEAKEAEIIENQNFQEEIKL